MYQNSTTHLKNLQVARTILIKNKIQCDYCTREFTKGNIQKHTNTCYLNPLNIVSCPVCTSPIKNYKTSVTCSSGCANTFFRTGPDHGNWSEKQYRSTCFHYHKKECVICGEANVVAVHHLDENRENNNPDNLIPLCPTHHQYYHSTFRYIVEPIILDYLIEWRKNYRPL